MILIKTEKLTKEYHTATTNLRAIYDVDLEVNAGECLAITGSSGAGKSTLLHLLGFLDQPTSGHYYFDGQNVGRLSLEERASIRNSEIGFVFQDSLLLPNLNATDNVALPLIYGGILEAEAETRARHKLMELGLGDRLAFYPWQMSGGEQQRVAIARAFAMEPKLILADEPTGNLDSDNAKHIMDLLLQLNREKAVTVILVTHEVELARQTRRIVTVRDGKVS